LRYPDRATGVLAAVGPARRADLAAFTDCGLNLIRLRALVNPVEDVVKWRDAGAGFVLLQAVCPSVTVSPLSPETFVERFSPDLDAYLTAGVSYVEIHDEPNRADRGAGILWQDGGAFGIWFEEVAHRLRARFGRDLRLGFPGLAPTDMPRPEPSAPIDAATFLDQCSSAVRAADWLALHLYWRTLEEMRALDGPMRWLREVAEVFRKQPVIVSEYANVSDRLDGYSRGRQYSEFVTLMSQYDRVLGTCGLLLRSSDPHYSPLAWLEPDGRRTAVLGGLSERPRMPDAGQVWFSWPTEIQQYTRAFGASQGDYYRAARMTGGHNGVDLAIDVASPETSPITAAMGGTVTQVALDATGYGHHVRVQTYGPESDEIELLYAHLSGVEVTAGTLVDRGDLLGWGGTTGSGEPHLHLGMRVRGVPLPQVNDALNPRPYLDAPPRGWPRVPYARTYVLLPPDTDATWAGSAVATVSAAGRLTVGCDPDDAGIGALELRRVVAVNLDWWDTDLITFFNVVYPGAQIVPVTAATPEELARQLQSLPEMGQPSAAALFCRTSGLPRAQYHRTYILLPPSADRVWSSAAAEATWSSQRVTLGGSADDAGIGDLDHRRVVVVNPDLWEQDMRAFYETHYPGVNTVTIHAETPDELIQHLAELNL